MFASLPAPHNCCALAPRCGHCRRLPVSISFAFCCIHLRSLSLSPERSVSLARARFIAFYTVVSFMLSSERKAWVSRQTPAKNQTVRSIFPKARRSCVWIRWRRRRRSVSCYLLPPTIVIIVTVEYRIEYFFTSSSLCRAALLLPLLLRLLRAVRPPRSLVCAVLLWSCCLHAVDDKKKFKQNLVLVEQAQKAHTRASRHLQCISAVFIFCPFLSHYYIVFCFCSIFAELKF